MKFIDLSGNKYGRLTVIKRGDNKLRSDGKSSRVTWDCLCDCGNVINVVADRLKSGNTKSCGCLDREKAAARMTTHGMGKTKLYYVWSEMKQRCYNPKNKRYSDWGGRGITVCDEWKDSFINFYDWAIKNGYKEGLTIDRINNNGNYEPCNCRWETMHEQRLNQRAKKRRI